MAETAARPILLFGGSFDPLHNGHLALLDAAIAALDPSMTLLIPVGRPWQKTQRTLTDASHRLAMLRLACEQRPGVTVDERELSRPGPTYSVDTLLELRDQCGADTPLLWLIGGDSFAGLHTWHRAALLPTLVSFVVARRAGQGLQMPALLLAAVATPDELCATPAGAWATLAVDPPPLSSTAIRATVAAGNSIASDTPQALCAYIRQHRLYQ